MPIYQARPRMQVDARYFDDEGLRQHCIDEVMRRGGRAFFDNDSWEVQLRQAVTDYRANHVLHDRYETPDERDQALYEELLQSKQVIERNLPDKQVKQLCYPWYDASDHAIRASKKAGYSVNLFGQRDGRYTNVPGQDPFEVVRIEAVFLQRLPGKGRKNLWQTFMLMYRLRSLPSRLFPEGRLGIV
jgi:hypothetical protein